MASVHEQLSEQFHKWECRGRGWRVFSEPVYPEPPFVPFNGHYLPEQPIVDDGRRPTLLSSFTQRLSRKLSTSPPPITELLQEEDEPEPISLIRNPLVEFQASLPEKLEISKEAFEHFLLNLSLCHEPLAFELLGANGKILPQFVVHPDDAPLVRRQLQAHFPEAVFVPREGALDSAWDSCNAEEALAVEFGLARECMLPLQSGMLDPFVGIIGALSEVPAGGLGLFQVLWQPVQNPWAKSILRSVTHTDGKPFFVNEPELAGAAEVKIAKPMVAAVLRILVGATDFDAVLQLARDLAGSLRIFSNPAGNELIPLNNEEYPYEAHIEDVLCRQSRRAGMLLNSDELIGFVHLPGRAVRSGELARQTGNTKAAPPVLCRSSGLLLGENEHAGKIIPVRLTTEQRVRHCHIIGASGTGKSTLLYNLIKQDIESGQGVAVLDPHGDLVDKVIGTIPADRVQDLVLVDPSDEEYSVGFNILSAHSELEKNLLASDLVGVFERLSTSWGDQMNSVLQNAILAFLESTRGGTIADLRRFLIEPAYRTEFLHSVRDSEVVYYWQKSFPHLIGNKSIGSILTRLDMFLSKKPIRYMVAQRENRLDFAQIMNTSKIFLAKLPEGLLGRENSYLLGALIVSKFQQIAMSRQAQQTSERKPFWLYIDEFANFITPSMAEILSGARKYRVGLTLAHHQLHQLERDKEVASAVMTHPCTRIVFRVSDDDARRLAEGLSHFEPKDLRNLEVGQAICRIERSDYDFNLRVHEPAAQDNDQLAARQQSIIAVSRQKYGMSRPEIEALMAKESSVSLKQDAPPTLQVPSPVEKQKHAEPSAAVQRKTKESDHQACTQQIAQQPASPSMGPHQEEPLTPPSGSECQKAASPSQLTPPADMGRGGAQHKAIQQRIKEAAERLGFRSVVEKEVLGGQGSIDLFLEREGESIGCEISISTTIDHEVGNVSKCFKAGVSRVAVICLDDARLKRISAAILGSLGVDRAVRVGYYKPDEFITNIQAMRLAVPKAPAEPETRRGWKVKKSLTKLSAEEQKQRERAAIELIKQSMQKKASANRS